MTSRRVTAIKDSVSEPGTAVAKAPLEPLTVTLGALVEAVTELTDDVDEIIAVIHHVLRTRAVPLGDLQRRALIGLGDPRASALVTRRSTARVIEPMRNSSWRTRTRRTGADRRVPRDGAG